MSRPDLLPHVRAELLRHAHGKQLRAVRRSHRPLIAKEVLRGMRLVVRHAARLGAYAVLLVTAAAFTLDRFWPAPLP